MLSRRSFLKRPEGRRSVASARFAPAVVEIVRQVNDR